MEKSTAHYKLARIQGLVDQRRIVFTKTATAGFKHMGLRYREALDVLGRLQTQDFYKSMTTYADHTVWQDVYHPRTPYGSAYVKLTVLDDLLVVSFKVR
ncbi:MAG: type II toxin-antitoxin system MqsR family toxin [Cupriavidus sp.]|nr:type II toxin-antitoxin system MqsR family toxin [Cupriavidus sp.]